MEGRGHAQLTFAAALLASTARAATYHVETNGNDSVAIGCRDNASYTNKYKLLHSVPLCVSYPLLSQKNGPIVYGGATLSIPTSSLITDIAKGGDYNSAGIPLRTGGGHRNPFNDTEVKTVNMRLNYDLTNDIASGD